MKEELTPLELRWLSLYRQAVGQLGQHPERPYIYFSRVTVRPDSVHAEIVSTSILIDDAPPASVLAPAPTPTPAPRAGRNGPHAMELKRAN